MGRAGDESAEKNGRETKRRGVRASRARLEHALATSDLEKKTQIAHANRIADLEELLNRAVVVDADESELWDQARNLDQAHRRVVVAHYLAIDPSELTGAGQVLVAVRDVPRQADDVRSRRAGFCQDRSDAAKGLARLPDQVQRLEDLVGVPTDLTGNEYQSAFSANAVRVAGRALPRSGLVNLHVKPRVYW